MGLGWALWHLAINYLGLTGQYSGPLLFLLLLISTQLNFADSVLLSWIHNNTGSSMLLVILGHFSITMANMFGLSNPTIQDFIRANLVSVVIHWLVAIAIIVVTGSRRLARASRSSQKV